MARPSCGCKPGNFLALWLQTWQLSRLSKGETLVRAKVPKNANAKVPMSQLNYPHMGLKLRKDFRSNHVVVIIQNQLKRCGLSSVADALGLWGLRDGRGRRAITDSRRRPALHHTGTTWHGRGAHARSNKCIRVGGADAPAHFSRAFARALHPRRRHAAAMQGEP